MDPEELKLWEQMCRRRHQRWVARQTNGVIVEPDPILERFKFTNVFRVLDYGSQYLLNAIQQAENPRDALFFAAVYRYMNRPEPFRDAEVNLGHLPTLEDATSGRLKAEWALYEAQGGVFFGNAYTMFSGVENPGAKRWEWAMGVAVNVAQTDAFYTRTGVKAQVEALLSVPRVGVFMAQQIVTDFNYTRFHRGDENDYVFPGPGSLLGMSYLCPGEKPAALKKDFHERVAELRAILVLDEPQISLTGRPPSLMDVQNTLCEFGKYRKIASTGKGRRYVSAHPGATGYNLPTHWI